MKTCASISNYIYLNKTLLLSAYEESLAILFKTLRIYMEKDLTLFEKIKEDFRRNVHNCYTKRKNGIFEIKTCRDSSKNKNDKKNLEKSFDKNEKSLLGKKINEQKLINHRKNKSYMNKTLTNLLGNFSNNNNSTLNNKDNKGTKSFKSLAVQSLTNLTGANVVKSDFKEFKDRRISHRNERTISKYKNKNSYYSLLREGVFGGNNSLLSNSPREYPNQQGYNINLMSNFANLSKNVMSHHLSKNWSKCGNETYCNSEQNECNVNSFYLDDVKKNPTGAEKEIEHVTKLNKNILNKGHKSMSMTNNELINCIKSSLDENLKGIFDFSYENFLNKESEREGN